MSIARYIWTKEEAIEQLAIWKKALFELGDKGVKSYAIGSRKLEHHDLPEIQEKIEYFGRVLKALDEKTNARRTRTVVIRDL